MKSWSQFNESKNYGNLYHALMRHAPSESVDTCINILKQGLRFNRNTQAEMGKKRGNFKFLDGDFYISVTRTKSFKNYVTFILDGESISNKYKIEPFNMRAWNRDYEFYSLGRNNNKYMTEEKIVSKTQGYLDPKYIKEIVIRELSDDQINTIKENAGNIKVTVL